MEMKSTEWRQQRSWCFDQQLWKIILINERKKNTDDRLWLRTHKRKPKAKRNEIHHDDNHDDDGGDNGNTAAKATTKKKEKQIFNVARNDMVHAAHFFPSYFNGLHVFLAPFSPSYYSSAARTRNRTAYKRKRESASARENIDRAKEIQNELLRLIDAIIAWETSITCCRMRYMHIKRHKHNTNQMLSDHIIL